MQGRRIKTSLILSGVKHECSRRTSRQGMRLLLGMSVPGRRACPWPEGPSGRETPLGMTAEFRCVRSGRRREQGSWSFPNEGVPRREVGNRGMNRKAAAPPGFAVGPGGHDPRPIPGGPLHHSENLVTSTEGQRAGAGPGSRKGTRPRRPSLTPHAVGGAARGRAARRSGDRPAPSPVRARLSPCRR